VRPLALTLIAGTRPEVIKLAPVVRVARERPAAFRIRIVLTGQHPDLAAHLMEEFDLRADVELALAPPDRGLANTFAECLRSLAAVLDEDRPDWVLVQGDTTTAVAGALAAFYGRIPVAHVEAGLRSGCRTSPFPEEMHRRVIAPLADLHLAPTPQARRNLLEQGVPEASIVVTGNTVIDALFDMRGRLGTARSHMPRTPTDRYVLVTVHRRENHGESLGRICEALLGLLDRNDDLSLLLPVHPHPRVADVVIARLSGHPRIVLSKPLGYAAFVQALVNAALVLTDSGGVQEECAALGKPVLVLRGETERQEALAAGVAMLVGVAPDRIVSTATRLLTDPAAYLAMERPTDAYGDGCAAARILDAIERVTRATAPPPRCASPPGLVDSADLGPNTKD
jgi:UDP-N-acetylglucosamine 2-epimerase (non-hydrolysing)